MIQLSDYNKHQMLLKTLATDFIIYIDSIREISEFTVVFKVKTTSNEIFLYMIQYGKSIILDISEYHNMRRYFDIYSEEFLPQHILGEIEQFTNEG